MTEARRLQVQGIDHVLVVSSDLDKTRQFYCELLGMERMPRPDFTFPGLWFQAGKTQIHVTLASSDAGTPGTSPTNTGASPRETNPMFVRTPEGQETAEFFRELTGAQKKALSAIREKDLLLNAQREQLQSKLLAKNIWSKNPSQTQT